MELIPLLASISLAAKNRSGWLQVSDGYFQVMAAPPLLGRTFAPQEFLPGAGRAAVITFGLWMRRFGGDPKTVGNSAASPGSFAATTTYRKPSPGYGRMSPSSSHRLS
jgi:hypothetical protein